MRNLMLIATLALAGVFVAGIACAAPTVDITIGKDLQKKAHKYGERELTYLRQDLTQSIQSMAKRQGDPALDGAKFSLMIADAKPNRPTFQQMSDTTGLSWLSIGIGGASIEGSVTYADGRVIPVKYNWYDYDIYQAIGSNTWTAAERAFDMMAYKVARDGTTATR